MTVLVPVPRENVKQIFSLAEPELNRAIAFSGDRYSEGELERDLESGTRQIWLIWLEELLGVVVTKVFRKARICQIELCAGRNIKTWLHHLPEIEQFARDNGCKISEVIGRKGWLRLLPDYELYAVILRKKL